MSCSSLKTSCSSPSCRQYCHQWRYQCYTRGGEAATAAVGPAKPCQVTVWWKPKLEGCARTSALVIARMGQPEAVSHPQHQCDWQDLHHLPLLPLVSQPPVLPTDRGVRADAVRCHLSQNLGPSFQMD